jgi:hypothetical protein
MIRKTYRIRRITVAMALTASLAAWAAQPALALDGRSPDTREAAEDAKAGSVVDLRSPDAREAADQGKPTSHVLADLRSPDSRDAAHQTKPSSLVDLRSPDSRNAAHQTKPSSLVDFRSPDARDAAIPVVSETRVVAPELASSDRFHWGDFGIGVGVALGSTLLLAGLAAGALVPRKQRGESVGAAT